MVWSRKYDYGARYARRGYFYSEKNILLQIHQLYKILNIDDDGNIVLQSERYQGDMEDEEM